MVQASLQVVKRLEWVGGLLLACQSSHNTMHVPTLTIIIYLCYIIMCYHVEKVFSRQDFGTLLKLCVAYTGVSVEVLHKITMLSVSINFLCLKEKFHLKKTHSKLSQFIQPAYMYIKAAYTMTHRPRLFLSDQLRCVEENVRVFFFLIWMSWFCSNTEHNVKSDMG